MSAHTPGPWTWRQMGGWVLLGDHGMRPVVLACRGVRKSSGPPPPAEFLIRDPERDLLIPFDATDPNMRLIAAAPELMDALVDLQRHSRPCDCDACHDRSDFYREKALAAIAKAEDQ